MSIEFGNLIFDDRHRSTDQKKLSEEDIDNKKCSFRMERTITCSRDISYTLYRFDPNEEQLFPFFKRSEEGGLKGIRRVCDYFLFAENESTEEKFIFLIELKRGKDDPKVQLNMSEALINYIKDMAEKLGKPFDENIQIRKIGIREEDGKRKRPTKPSEIKYQKNFFQYSNPTHFRIAELMH